MLRAAWLACQQNGIDASDVQALAAHYNVQHEMRKIWASLAIEEQQALRQASSGDNAWIGDNDCLELLQLKGLLTKPAASVFSPLFNLFVSRQLIPDQAVLILDKATRRVVVHGEPTERLTSLEYRVFEHLYRFAEEIVSRDDLIEAGWPGAQGGVTDEAVNQVIRRIRKKLKQPDLLENIRGEGYRLMTQSAVA